MRFPLETPEEPFEKNLLFWIGRFVKYKATTLSSRLVSSEAGRKEMAKLIGDLAHAKTIREVDGIVRRLRGIGLEGVKSYFVPVREFYRYATALGLASMREIDQETVVDFLASATAGKSDATKKNYKNALVNFFRYLSSYNEDSPGSGRGYIYSLDLRNWQGLGGRSGLKSPDYLNEEEIGRLLACVDEKYSFKNREYALLYRFLVRFLYYTGLRISEALSLKEKQLSVDPDRDLVVVRVHGKGNKERIVAVKRPLILAPMIEWKEAVRCQERLLFCRPDGAPVSSEAVSGTIARLLACAGIRKRKSGAHLLRHSYATNLYAKTRDLALVQDLLGHESPKTTRIYTHVDKEKLLEAADVFAANDKKE